MTDFRVFSTLRAGSIAAGNAHRSGSAAVSELNKRLRKARMSIEQNSTHDIPCSCTGKASPCSQPAEVSRRLRHFRRPAERHFLAEDRDKVTVLFGGFTWKHERLIAAILRRAGYRCQQLPTPDLPAYELGKEYGNNGQCNPTYFTVGSLIHYLRSLEVLGL